MRELVHSDQSIAPRDRLCFPSFHDYFLRIKIETEPKHCAQNIAPSPSSVSFQSQGQGAVCCCWNLPMINQRIMIAQPTRENFFIFTFLEANFAILAHNESFLTTSDMIWLKWPFYDVRLFVTHEFKPPSSLSLSHLFLFIHLFFLSISFSLLLSLYCNCWHTT